MGRVIDQEHGRPALIAEGDRGDGVGGMNVQYHVRRQLAGQASQPRGLFK